MSHKIVEYKTAYNNQAKLLDIDVNTLLQQGWVPYGSPTSLVRDDGCGYWYTQAMVKYEETDN